MIRPARKMGSLYTAARRYKTQVARIDRRGPVIRDLIFLVWLYRHGDRSPKLHFMLEDVVQRAKTFMKDHKGDE